MWERYHKQIIVAAAGAGVDHVTAHPYTMFIYTLMHPHRSDMLLSQWRRRALFDTAAATFQPAMLPMALSFVMTGRLVGLLAGVAVERKRRLDAMTRESERERVALETLHELMVTLSHYVLNANTIIGGMVRHCKRIDSNQEILHSRDRGTKHTKGGAFMKKVVMLCALVLIIATTLFGCATTGSEQTDAPTGTQPAGGYGGHGGHH